MAVYSVRKANWSRVKGDFKSEMKICPRCKNTVQYELVTDGDGIGFPGFFTIKYKHHYGYKCPICPNLEVISKEKAVAIMKGN
jgi:hypothetical protein